MEIKTAKTCEACEQPFEADRQLEGRQAYCSMPECQRERRRRSQRRLRAAKSSLNQPRVETSIGGENSAELHGASCGFTPDLDAHRITEDPFILGLMPMLCDTENLDELRTMMTRLKKRGQEISKRQEK
jgi:hypothetical protein